ncbi:MAG: hypothetical protein IPI58_07280 [Alphaproteobacteria bacterium]|nr:MAG: hypothetical protein IPI58_07280 [Alphaproteobacteria bacterium]
MPDFTNKPETHGYRLSVPMDKKPERAAPLSSTTHFETQFDNALAQTLRQAGLTGAEAGDDGAALARLYAYVADRLGQESVSRLNRVLWSMTAEPASVPELLRLLRDQACHAWREWHLRVDNTYVNRELGEARPAYVETLQRRYNEAQHMFEEVLSVVQSWSAQSDDTKDPVLDPRFFASARH